MFVIFFGQFLKGRFFLRNDFSVYEHPVISDRIHDGFAGDLDFSQHIRILCLDGFDQSAVEIVVWFEPGQDCGPLQLFASDDHAVAVQLEHDDRSGSQLPCPFAYRNSAVRLQFVVFIAEMFDLKKIPVRFGSKKR